MVLGVMHVERSLRLRCTALGESTVPGASECSPRTFPLVPARTLKLGTVMRTNTTRTPARLAFAVVAIGLLVAGCGKKATSTTTASTTKLGSTSTAAAASLTTAAPVATSAAALSSSTTAASKSATTVTAATAAATTVKGAIATTVKGATTTAKSTGSTSAASSAPVGMAAGALSVVTDAKLGKILVDGSGHVAYLFTKDTATASTCTGSCVTAWPPLVGTPTAGAGVDATKIGSIKRSDGSQQVTYGGHPLYEHAKDAVGAPAGEGANGNWFAVSPAGDKV